MQSNDDRIIDLLEELVLWTKFAARDSFVALLNNTLIGRKHWEVYELSDGTRTQSQIGAAAGVSQQYVSDLWQRWRPLGLLREVNGRTAHLVRPVDLSIEPPAEEKTSAAPRRRSRRATTTEGQAAGT